MCVPWQWCQKLCGLRGSSSRSPGSLLHQSELNTTSQIKTLINATYTNFLKFTNSPPVMLPVHCISCWCHRRNLLHLSTLMSFSLKYLFPGIFFYWFSATVCHVQVKRMYSVPKLPNKEAQILAAYPIYEWNEQGMYTQSGTFQLAICSSSSANSLFLWRTGEEADKSE